MHILIPLLNITPMVTISLMQIIAQEMMGKYLETVPQILFVQIVMEPVYGIDLPPPQITINLIEKYFKIL